MNFDVIENLTEEEIMQLYDNLQDSLAWRCICKTNIADSNCKCEDTSIEYSSTCRSEQFYSWYFYDNRYFEQFCNEYCNSSCSSNNCVSSAYGGYSDELPEIGSFSFSYCATR